MIKKILLGLLAINIVAFSKPVSAGRSFSRPSVSRSVSVSRPRPVSVRPKTTVTHKSTYTAPKVKSTPIKTKPITTSNFTSSTNNTSTTSSTPTVIHTSSGNGFLTNMMLFNALKDNNDKTDHYKYSSYSDAELIRELEIRLEELKKEKNPNKELIKQIEELIAKLKRR